MIRLRMRTRLTLWFAASIVVILAPCLAGVLALEWRSMRAALDHHLQEDLEVALEMLVVRESEVTWRTDTDRDHGYDAGYQRWVEVYSTSGFPLFLRGRAREEAIRADLVAASLDPVGFRSFRTPGGARVRALLTVRHLGPAPVRVRVVRSEDGLWMDFQQLVLLFSITVPLAIVGAALAGYVVSGRALGPLGRMAERARSISAERLSERLPVENTADELGQLASVFNETFARLEASFDRLNEFTADVSHELRTPLTAIRSVGEVGLRGAHDAGAYREVIGSMLEEADRLARMVDTLLTLSRWERGHVRPAADAIDLGVLAQDVTDQLSVLAEERGIQIDVAVPPALVVRADPIMARQALTNVLDNAIKFTPEGGRIRVAGSRGTHEHHLAVDDDGPGIPTDQRRRVLDRFYRIETGARGHDVRGMGLGLAIVERAMTANGGRVAIDGNDAGGTHVVLSLPCSEIIHEI